VISENDGMAGGVVAALEAQGLAGTVPVTGQDGDKAALNRVALGTQLVSIWKDSRALGKIAAEAALMLSEGKSMEEVPNVGKFKDGARKVEMNAVLLTPTPVLKANLGDVIAAGWVDKATVCAGVTDGVDACK
jgi:D-xylose transport system substrate-binding protein